MSDPEKDIAEMKELLELALHMIKPGSETKVYRDGVASNTNKIFSEQCEALFSRINKDNPS